MKISKQKLRISRFLFALFLLWTILLCCTDRQAIGPNSSVVGLASLNKHVHNLTGVHLALYTLTDWLGLVPITVCAGFGIFGLIQWVRRKSVVKVDTDILLLGGFYLLVAASFVFFEIFVVNYRPVLIDSVLEASYPSSTTMLVISVMCTAMMQVQRRISKLTMKQILSVFICLFTAMMVILRLISGVHWFTDIIGGILLSASLVVLYSAFLYPKEK